jgi:hypothetical protein
VDDAPGGDSGRDGEDKERVGDGQVGAPVRDALDLELPDGELAHRLDPPEHAEEDRNRDQRLLERAEHRDLFALHRLLESHGELHLCRLVLGGLDRGLVLLHLGHELGHASGGLETGLDEREDGHSDGEREDDDRGPPGRADRSVDRSVSLTAPTQSAEQKQQTHQGRPVPT